LVSFWALCAAFAAVLSIAAQTGQVPPPPTAPVTPQQTFRTGADIIEVDASVFDKNGKPVTDLTAADFVIRENGAPQAIQAIYLVSGDPAIARPALATGSAATTGMPRRVELKQRVFVFVLDLAHLSAAGFTRSRGAIESFLKDGATPADVLGIVVGGQMLNNRLDTDKAALLTALAAVPGPNQSRFTTLREWPRLMGEGEATQIAHGDTTVLNEAVRRGCAEQPGECDSRAGDEPVRRQVESKARLTAAEAAHDAKALLLALQALANGLGRFPGTKQVAVFSEGFYADEMLDSIHQVVGIAAQNGVRFSTLDARGLSSGPTGANFLGQTPTPTSAGVNLDTDADVLSSLAFDTGGRFVQRFNDLRPSLDAIARESGTYYVLGYSPANPLDGSFRKIEVTVTRKDLTVRARRGYIASPRPASATSPDGAITRSPERPIAPSLDQPTAPTLDRPIVTSSGGSIVRSPDAPASAGAGTLRLRPGGADHVAALDAGAPPVTGAAADAARALDLARQGWNLYGAGEVEHARDRLAASVATGAAPLWAEYALGLSEFALKHYDRAIDSWEHVRRIRPDYEQAYLDLADAYISLSRLGDVLTVLREAARRWPSDPVLHNAMGVTLVRRNDLDGAVKEFELATEVAPGDGLGFYNLGRAYQLRYERLQQTAANPNAPAAQSIGDRDRQHAIDAYTHYVSLGGPFEKQAKDAIAALQWKFIG
jgi:VWFA-related protein